MASRSMKEESGTNYVNSMEVSGIDPQIVREEHQSKLKTPASQSFSLPSQQPFDPNAFQNFMTQQALSQAQAQLGSGSSQSKVVGQTHLPQRPHIPQQQGAQPQQQQQQQFQQFPQVFIPGQVSQPNQSMRSSQQVSGNTRSSQNAGMSQKIQQPRDLMHIASENRLSTPPARVGKRRVRLGWTDEETQHLMEGCKRHGVGNWKKILTDPHFDFNCRTAVDLKDRFRTSFPEEYSRLYPNARTHKVKRMGAGNEVSTLVKINRKERRSFTPEEDERLLQGFLKHGPAWSKIQRDPMLNLNERRSTDLRDRFRNAFPERYTAAGYKGRSGNAKQLSLPGGEISSHAPPMQQMPPMNMLEDEVNVNLQQHGMVQRTYMPQHPMQLQSMQGMGGYQYFGS